MAPVNFNQKISLDFSNFQPLNFSLIGQRMKDVDWPQFSRRFFKSLLDMKNVAAICGLFVIVVMVGMEHIYTPMMKEVAAVDTQIKQKQDEEKKSKDLQNQYKSWQSALKDVKSQFLTVQAGESPRVVALKESESLVSMARGDLTDSGIKSALPAPHDALVVKSVTFQEDRSTPFNLAAQIPDSDSSILNSLGQDKASMQLNLDRYVYKLTLQGTYAALAGYLNNLVSRDRVIEISELSFKPSGSASEQAQASAGGLDANSMIANRPDPTVEPDAPVMVTMEMVVTIYLQSDGAAAPSQ
ncbi:MAG: hypothetical protein AB7P76_11970 [Candidatus Melainabacteria bacterium]